MSPETSSFAPSWSVIAPVSAFVQPCGDTPMRSVPSRTVTGRPFGASVNTPAPVFVIDAPAAPLVGTAPRCPKTGVSNVTPPAPTVNAPVCWLNQSAIIPLLDVV